MVAVGVVVGVAVGVVVAVAVGVAVGVGVGVAVVVAVAVGVAVGVGVGVAVAVVVTVGVGVAMSDPMRHIDIRAPGGDVRAWKRRARASGLTLSAWARRALNQAPAYTPAAPTPRPLEAVDQAALVELTRGHEATCACVGCEERRARGLAP